MTQEARISPSELQLLRKEIEAQGEFLNQERLERKTDVESLNEEIAELRERIDALSSSSSRFDLPA